MNYYTPKLNIDNIVLKSGSLEDYLKVYEYDFSKLTGIWDDILFEKNFKENIEAIFNEIENQNNTYSWIIYYNDLPVGHIVADRENRIINNSIELSYNLHPSYWGKGIMIKGIKLVCNYLFNTYDNIVICYCTGNEKSKKLLAKLDFKYYKRVKKAYSRNNKYVDEYIYYLTKKR